MVYLVRWSLHVEADSPEEAAQLARDEQLNSNSPATTFFVEEVENTGTAVQVSVKPATAATVERLKS
jgi:hypothetical protein